MANYAIWNVRLRHESLSKPRKAKYQSKRKRARIGLQEAIERKGSSSEASAQES